MTGEIRTLNCHVCNKEVQRLRPVSNPICFDCKLKSKRSRSIERHYKNYQKQKEIKEIKRWQYGKNSINKPCETCGEIMIRVWKTKRFCSSKCQINKI